MKRNALPIAALVVTSALLFSACEEEAAEVVKTGDDSSVVVEGESAEDADAEEASDDAEGDEDAAKAEAPATAGLGDTVNVGDWDVKVTQVVLDASKQIAAANQFNETAAGQYVLVTYEATYGGSERTADVWSDLSWSYTTADQQVNDTVSVVTPADNEEWPTEARSGGTVKGQVAFDLPADQIAAGLLSVEGYDADFDSVYADFAIAG